VLRRVAVRFPDFSIDRILRSTQDAARVPLALTERRGGRDVVVARSEIAAAAGVARVLSCAASATREKILRAEGPPREALAPLPIAALRPTPQAAAACAAFGLRTLGAIFDLPRASLPARFGDAFAEAVRAALGEREDLPPRFEAPEALAEDLEFPAPTEGLGPILFAATRVFAALEEALLSRDEDAAEAVATLRLSGAPPFVARLRPSVPRRAADAWTRLLHHRLEASTLLAPVEGLKVEIPASARVPSGVLQGMFFPDPGLASRLGPARVTSPRLVADPRPERAFRLTPTGAAAESASDPAPPPGLRPLELCAAPTRIEVAADPDGFPRAWREGGRLARLRVVRGPERAAGGWWDGADADRAYFEVETREGLRLWLFRDLVDGAFFRHGAFL
jgi:protein ImuB